MLVNIIIGIDLTYTIPLFWWNMINIRENMCDYCGACVTVCPVDCIEVRESSIMIEHPVCIDCDLCVIICPIEVLETRAAE